MFVDEVMFTSNQSCSRVWAHSGIEGPTAIKNKLSFPAIGAVIALSLEGRVVALRIKEGSISHDDFEILM